MEISRDLVNDEFTIFLRNVDEYIINCNKQRIYSLLQNDQVRRTLAETKPESGMVSIRIDVIFIA